MNEIIQKMFPTGTVNGRGGTEVNGLSSGTIPQGNILKQGPSIFGEKNRRDWFFVECDGYTALMRICTAFPDSGYDEFAVIHGITSNSDESEVDRLSKFFDRQTQK